VHNRIKVGPIASVPQGPRILWPIIAGQNKNGTAFSRPASKKTNVFGR